MAMTLSTIGYEGSTVEDFIETLLLAKVTVVADIRDVPVSRKRGFSKYKLAAALEEAGIGYVHLRALGDPRDGRAAARAGDYRLFLKIYAAVLKSDPAKEALAELSGMIECSRVCLLCYERAPETCHRTLVAERVEQDSGCGIVHLGVRHGLAAKRAVRTVPSARKGLASRRAAAR